MQQDTDNQGTDNQEAPRHTDYQDETEEMSNLTNTADVITDAHGHPKTFVAVCYKSKKGSLVSIFTGQMTREDNEYHVHYMQKWGKVHLA